MEVEFGVNLSSRAGAVADDAALAGAAEPSLSASVSGIPATRRLVPLTRLRVLAADPRPTGPADSAFDDVLAALTRYRIVTTGTTPSGAPPGEPAAELIHDTLIRDWTDLRDWVARDHDFQSWLQRATEQQARHAGSGHPGDLLDGSLLAEGEEWASRRPLPPEVASPSGPVPP